MQSSSDAWRAKSDEELADAARRLIDYTPDGRLAIASEMRRRGFAAVDVDAVEQWTPPAPAQEDAQTRRERRFSIATSLIFSLSYVVWATLRDIAAGHEPNLLDDFDTGATRGVVAGLVGFGFAQLILRLRRGRNSQ